MKRAVTLENAKQIHNLMIQQKFKVDEPQIDPFVVERKNDIIHYYFTIFSPVGFIRNRYNIHRIRVFSYLYFVFCKKQKNRVDDG